MRPPIEMKITSHLCGLDKVRVRFNLRSYFGSSVILFSTNNMVCDIPVVNPAHIVGFFK